MSLKPLEVRVPITELLTLVEKKSKQTDLNDTPEPISLTINDLSYSGRVFSAQWLSSSISYSFGVFLNFSGRKCYLHFYSLLRSEFFKNSDYWIFFLEFCRKSRCPQILCKLTLSSIISSSWSRLASDRRPLSKWLSLRPRKNCVASSSKPRLPKF